MKEHLPDEVETIRQSLHVFAGSIFVLMAALEIKEVSNEIEVGLNNGKKFIVNVDVKIKKINAKIQL